MNRRQFLQGLAAGTTVALIGGAGIELPRHSVKLQTEDAFLLTTANPLWEERLKTATFAHKLDDRKYLVWGDDPTTLGELERIVEKHSRLAAGS